MNSSLILTFGWQTLQPPSSCRDEEKQKSGGKPEPRATTSTNKQHTRLPPPPPQPLRGTPARVKHLHSSSGFVPAFGMLPTNPRAPPRLGNPGVEAGQPLRRWLSIPQRPPRPSARVIRLFPRRSPPLFRFLSSHPEPSPPPKPRRGEEKRRGDAGRPPRDKPQPRGHRRRRPPQDGGGRAGRGGPHSPQRPAPGPGGRCRRRSGARPGEWGRRRERRQSREGRREREKERGRRRGAPPAAGWVAGGRRLPFVSAPPCRLPAAALCPPPARRPEEIYFPPGTCSARLPPSLGPQAEGGRGGSP